MEVSATVQPDMAAEAADRLNEEFHRLLREAAEQREQRSLIQSTQDAEAARRESADLLSLARSVGPGRVGAHAES
jgi:uncharacterized membrane protein